MQTVVLYGKSLVVSTFGAGLEGCPGLRLLRVDPSVPDADQQLGAIRPNVVIFDFATEHTDFAISLWKALPGVMLIGVRADRSKLLVLSASQQQVLCVEDLLSIIKGESQQMIDSNSKTFDGGNHEKKCFIP